MVPTRPALYTITHMYLTDLPIYIYTYIYAGVLPHYPPLPPKQSYPTIHFAPPPFPTKTSNIALSVVENLFF